MSLSSRSFSSAAHGKPGEAAARETILRRGITQALRKEGWSLSTLNKIAALALLEGAAPEQAAGSVEAARAAFLSHEPKPTVLRQQLLGALSVPGWQEARLIAVDRLLSERAYELDAVEPRQARPASEGMR